MLGKHVKKLIPGSKYTRTEPKNPLNLIPTLYHSSNDSQSHHIQELSTSSEFSENKSFLKISKLTQLLKNVDSIDGRLIDIRDDSIITNDRVEQKMRAFKSLARDLIGSDLGQKALKTNMVAHSESKGSSPFSCFSKPSERESLTVSSLTQVGNFLNISAQQRKTIRVKICPQVTQHHIWTGALEEVLKGLKPELDYLNLRSPSRATHMGHQIVSNCLKIFSDRDSDNSTSWMRLLPPKTARSSSSSPPPTSLKWEDILEMFNDLIECLKNQDALIDHTVKLESMREGLTQMKDVLMDKSFIGYKEARHQEILVKKKLTKFLGYSSQCLFTLLLYYICGQVRDIEIDLCGGVYNNGGKKKSFCLCIGKVLTCDEEKTVMSGIRQLDRALGLFKFVWEIAGIIEVLDLQGHIWCVGAECKMVKYNGKKFFIHGINM